MARIILDLGFPALKPIETQPVSRLASPLQPSSRCGRARKASCRSCGPVRSASSELPREKLKWRAS
ncbi:hypothetical protein M431DRAFT_509052 [Trichoderma harzianum CBS 226.95]|uniref:Uncharacterized protein n=1 Tax=Trichoderma harzianum CBS 226.95 TaxID=983964 RepID=A0A2T4AAF0_TRIHA|nr:hypothetical protein M431DRAFT_509052 [Trichoderma harzianum CBS 226.95]PTB54036.1 hypothetical protein M431DRAFT_509052 [Trichoderma harzianum CBS 226.95]